MLGPDVFIRLLIFFFTAVAVSSPTNLARGLQNRAVVPYPGPIPYQDPHVGLPDQQSVTSNIKQFGLQTDAQSMKDCLVVYGSNQFYNSWQGNVCGGLGWFKGSKNSKIDPYDCYQTCASWIEGQGILYGAKDYQCDMERGTKGHCWMGYHPVDPSSTPSPDLFSTIAPPSSKPSTGSTEIAD